MSRPSHSITVHEDIPSYLTPDDVIKSTHDHLTLAQLQPLVTAVRAIPADEVNFTWFGRAEEEYFGEDAKNIKHYMIEEIITFVPGIGDYGKKLLKFPARFANVPNGVKGWADAPSGVSVASHFEVIEKEGVPGAWILQEKATVECSSLLMPFVRRSFTGAHQAMCKEIIAKAKAAGRGGAAELPS